MQAEVQELCLGVSDPTCGELVAEVTLPQLHNRGAMAEGRDGYGGGSHDGRYL